MARRLIAAALLAVALPAAGQTPSPSPDPTAALIQTTCAACHPVPSPDVLPRSAWKSVVLDMTGLIVQGVGLPKGVKAPSADFDAERIAYWFEQRAPQALPSPEPWPAVGTGAARFERKALTYPAAKGPAAIANVRLARLAAGGATAVIAADMLSGSVLAGSEPLKLLGRVPHPCHVEVVDLDQDGLLDLLVADLGAPAPSDDTKGSVQWLRARPDKTYVVVPLATALPRTADAQAGDFDGDGDLDVVVAAFGWRKVGGILLLENRTTVWTKPTFVPRTLDERTGAIHVPVTDLDGDGKLDFVALLSQHHETVVAFLGDGKGGFRQQTIDAAPHPAWGSSGIQLVDLDGDKDQDVLVTNGDMLDDYQLKPYHGIRWLENKGAFPFVAHDVAPMHGVIRAQAADLDGDGDLDIVAGSLVQVASPSGPTKSADAPSLVWLEQTSPGVFARHTLERGAQHLSLDLGDIDADGRVDIVTANSLSGGSGVVEVWRNRGDGPLSVHDRRLIGTWKSDRRRTMREVDARADFSPKAKDLLRGIMGHLVLRYTRTLCHSIFRGTTKATRYTVVGSNADGLLVVWPGEDPDGRDTLQHLRFEGKDLYWVSLGAFREFFRRVRPAPATSARGRGSRSPARRAPRR